MATGTRYPDIQRILDDAVGGAELPTHGAFWRTLDRDGFVAHEVFGCRIVASVEGCFLGHASPLIGILRGPIECPAERRRRRMPRGLPPVSDAAIQVISDWIDDQCPA